MEASLASHFKLGLATRLIWMSQFLFPIVLLNLDVVESLIHANCGLTFDLLGQMDFSYLGNLFVFNLWPFEPFAVHSSLFV